MTALPNPSAPLFEGNGRPTSILRDLMANLPNGALVDEAGRMTPLFRNYLMGRVTKPLPSLSQPIGDAEGRPTRAMTYLLMGLA